MASGQTSNYGLNQWAAEDKVLREEFNQDNARLDEAMAALKQPTFKIAVLEDYNGTTDLTIELGRQPAMVMVGNRLGWTNIITTSSSTSDPAHAVALPGHPGYFSGMSSDAGKNIALEITDTGFKLYKGFAAGFSPYYYLALFT